MDRQYIVAIKENLDKIFKGKTIAGYNKGSDVAIAHKTANQFLKYLQENDCDTTGPFDEKRVGIKESNRSFNILLESQTSYIEFDFDFDGSIDVESEADGSDEEDFYVCKTFNSYAQFVNWYKQQGFTWTSDLGAKLTASDESFGELNLQFEDEEEIYGTLYKCLEVLEEHGF